MPQKTIPMSVRLSDDDATFVATLEIDGATTPSDKLRALVAEARQRRLGVQDHAQCHAMMRDLISPALHRVREAEREQGVHSELLAHLADWLPEAVATLITPSPDRDASTDDDADESSLDQLRYRERLVADQAFRLIEDIIRMGVTRESRCYDRGLIREHLGPTLELAHVIDGANDTNKEKQL